MTTLLHHSPKMALRSQHASYLAYIKWSVISVSCPFSHKLGVGRQNIDSGDIIRYENVTRDDGLTSFS